MPLRTKPQPVLRSPSGELLLGALHSEKIALKKTVLRVEPVFNWVAAASFGRARDRATDWKISNVGSYSKNWRENLDW